MIHLSARMDMNNAMALSSRRWYSHGLEFSLRIPRSRSGNFYPVLLGLIRRRAKSVQSCSIFFTPKVLPPGRQVKYLRLFMDATIADSKFLV